MFEKYGTVGGYVKKWHTPWKINMVHLQITHSERKIIFQTSMELCSMLNFRGVL